MALPLRNTPEKYGAIAQTFHWTMALLMLTGLALGVTVAYFLEGQARMPVMNIHKGIGVTILGLAFFRLGWRLSVPQPGKEPNHRPWERALAYIVHTALYTAFFLMPLSGWGLSSAAGYPVGFFGLFTLPPLVGKSAALADLFRAVHFYAGWTVICLVALHLGGVFKHLLIDRDRTVFRMLPFGRGGKA